MRQLIVSPLGVKKNINKKKMRWCTYSWESSTIKWVDINMKGNENYDEKISRKRGSTVHFKI